MYPGETLQAGYVRTTFHRHERMVSIARMKKAILPVVLLGMLLLTGCVERRIYVRSDPPGASVFIDGEYIGETRPDDHVDGPLYANFIFYGTREYTLRKPGYATTSGRVELEAPWYEYPPIDFFSEVLTPWIIVDEHEIVVDMEKAKPANVDELYRNALNYRYASRAEERYVYADLWAPRRWTPRKD